jgi:hypothetical protein
MIDGINCQKGSRNEHFQRFFSSSKLEAVDFFKEAIPLCENLEVYIYLRLDTTIVHNSR